MGEGSEFDGRDAEYHDATDVYQGYFACPASQRTPLPCVLLGHDWSGLNDGMRRAADRIARLGLPCFAFDVYGAGRRGDPGGDNTPLLRPLMDDRALLRQILVAAMSHVQSRPEVEPDRIVAMGYCFGGLCALDLARASPPGLIGAISVHGDLRPPRAGPQPKIEASILILHGWEDPIAPPSDLLAIAGELTDAGADWQIHAYGRAMHAFTFVGVDMPERGLKYDKAASERSWMAVQNFLGERAGLRLSALEQHQ